MRDPMLGWGCVLLDSYISGTPGTTTSSCAKVSGSGTISQVRFAAGLGYPGQSLAVGFQLGGRDIVVRAVATEITGRGCSRQLDGDTDPPGQNGVLPNGDHFEWEY